MNTTFYPGWVQYRNPMFESEPRVELREFLLERNIERLNRIQAGYAEDTGDSLREKYIKCMDYMMKLYKFYAARDVLCADYTDHIEGDEEKVAHILASQEASLLSFEDELTRQQFIMQRKFVLQFGEDAVPTEQGLVSYNEGAEADAQ